MRGIHGGGHGEKIDAVGELALVRWEAEPSEPRLQRRTQALATLHRPTRPPGHPATRPPGPPSVNATVPYMLLMPFSGRFSSVVACRAFRYKAGAVA
jgi:hypothetical protein